MTETATYTVSWTEKTGPWNKPTGTVTKSREFTGYAEWASVKAHSFARGLKEGGASDVEVKVKFD